MLVLVLALIVFGPNKLPELGRAVGRTLSEFKKSTHELTSCTWEETNEINKEVKKR